MKETAASIQRNDWLTHEYYDPVDKINKTIDFPKELEGGRNLIFESKKTSKIIKIYGVDASIRVIGKETDKKSEVILIDNIKRINGNYVFYFSLTDIAKETNQASGQEFTLSLELKSDIQCNLYASINNGNIKNHTSKKITNKFNKVSFNITPNRDNPPNLNTHFIIDGDIKKIYVKNVKLEKGKKATPYTHSPEDLNLSISKNVEEFIPTGDKNSTLASSREFIEYPEELEGGRNIALNSAKVTKNSENTYSVRRNLDLTKEIKKGDSLAVSYNYKIANAVETHPSIRLGIEGNYKDAPGYYMAWKSFNVGESIEGRAEFVSVCRADISNISAYLQVGGESAEIFNIKLEINTHATPYTPAPEDLGLDYPDSIREFKPCIAEDYVMGKEIISYPEELTGGRNLILNSSDLTSYNLNYSPNREVTLIDMTKEWGFSEAYKFKLSGATTSYSAVWTSRGYLSEDMNFNQVYTHSMYVKNVGQNSVTIYKNGIMGGVDILLEPNKGGKISFTGTRRKDYDWYQIHFRPKVLGEEIKIIAGRQKLEKSKKSTNWTPAPEDLNYNYPDWVGSFKPSIQKEGIIMQDYKEGSQFIEPNKNLLPNSHIEKTNPNGGEFFNTYDLEPLFDKYGTGTKYSLSIDIKSKDISKSNRILVYMQNGSGTKYNFVNTQVVVTEEYQRFYFEGLTPKLSNESEKGARLAFYGTYNTGNTPIVKNIKLELGDKATQWTPAPEDYGREEW